MYQKNVQLRKDNKPLAKQIMKTNLLLVLVILSLFSSCKETQSDLEEVTLTTNKILMLKVDYLTQVFEGGKEITYPSSPSTFTVTHEYLAPGDFGSIKLYYQELDQLLFSGTIIWMGKGEMSFPQNLTAANKFNRVLTKDVVYPNAGFENVFNPQNTDYDDHAIWLKVQGLVKVRAYLNANRSAKVKLFLYTPSVGVGNPADWDWFIFIQG